MQGNKQIITVGVSEEPVRGEAGLVCVLDISIVLEEGRLLQMIKTSFLNMTIKLGAFQVLLIYWQRQVG